MATKKVKATCRVEGCERPVLSEKMGLCNGHYRRYYRAVKRWEDNNGKEASTRVKNNIMRKVLKSAPLRLRRTKPVRCSVSGCKQFAIKRGLCNKHYTQAYREDNLPPIKRVS